MDFYGAYQQPARGGAASVARGKSGMESVEETIRDMEMEAYKSVLRVLSLSELSWSRDDLLGRLRKELNIDPSEHDNIKMQLMQDQSIARLREAIANPSAHQPPAKKQRVSTGYNEMPARAKSMPLPAPKRQPPPKAATIKKPTSSKPMAKPGAPAVVVNEHVGKQVRRLWEGDGWYTAMISDYRVDSDEHCIVYDINTPEESYEWVRLADLKRSEFQWLSDKPSFEALQMAPAPKQEPPKPAAKPSASGGGRQRGGSAKKAGTGGGAASGQNDIGNLVNQIRTVNNADQLNGIQGNLKDREAELQARLAALDSDEEDSDDEDEQMYPR